MALTDIAVPTTGCGQLIGADERGQGIAVPLIGAGTDVTLIQDPRSPNRITVRTSTGSATATMVTTPDEIHYIGESLAAR